MLDDKNAERIRADVQASEKRILAFVEMTRKQILESLLGMTEGEMLKIETHRMLDRLKLIAGSGQKLVSTMIHFCELSLILSVAVILSAVTTDSSELMLIGAALLGVAVGTGFAAMSFKKKHNNVMREEFSKSSKQLNLTDEEIDKQMDLKNSDVGEVRQEPPAQRTEPENE